MTLHDATTKRNTQNSTSEDFPWWLLAILVIGIALAAMIAVNGIYTQVFSTVAKGVGITVSVTLTAFMLATLLGLCIALVGMADNIVARQVARFYIEVVRGIPIIVLLFYIAFVVVMLIVSQTWESSDVLPVWGTKMTHQTNQTF